MPYTFVKKVGTMSEDEETRAYIEGPSNLSNIETISLISNLLDTKLNAKFDEFKRKLDKQELSAHREFKKIKLESKATSSFEYKGNRLQYEFNVELLDIINEASDKLLEEDLRHTNGALKALLVGLL